MKHISYKLVNESVGIANVSIKGNKYTFEYPCSDNHDCTDYEIQLSPGKYTIELYGASGGHDEGYISLFQDPTEKGCIKQNIKGNVECVQKASMAGAGGYTRGTINIKEITRGFLSIGGSGVYGTVGQISNTEECYSPENMMKGGYNGGASSANYYSNADVHKGTGSGGGATDLRMEKNDLYHRILVAGGGGGCDNKAGTYRGGDDGSGGAGGGLVAQGYFVNGQYDGTKIANQTFGFSFGTGQAPWYTAGCSDRTGGGGGWYGGFTSNSPDGGAGGGSSFALTKNSEITKENITALNEFGQRISCDYYAFNSSSSYVFRSVLMNAGVWDGNGIAVITYKTPFCTFAHKGSKLNYSFIFVMIIAIKA